MQNYTVFLFIQIFKKKCPQICTPLKKKK